MEDLSLSARIIKTFISVFFWLRFVVALTLVGSFLGLMVNLVLNKDSFNLNVFVIFTVIGFLTGFVKAESLRKQEKLVEHMAALLETPEIDQQNDKSN